MPDPKQSVAAFGWSARMGRYQYRNGKPVQTATMAGWIDSAIGTSRARVAALTEELVAGRINTAEWTLGMQDEIRAGHRMMMHLAYGPDLSRSEIGRLGAIVRAQYQYLRAFSAGLESGEIPRGPGAVNRAGLYMDALWNTWQNETARAERKRGKTQIINILNPVAEHCAGCLAESARGWIAIGKEVPIGARDCRVRDRCHFEFR